MNRGWICLSLLVLFGAGVVAQVRTIADPQMQMSTARLQSVGGSNPVIPGDIGGILINPAAAGGINSIPFSITSQKILGAFNYQLINSSFPIEIPISVQDRVKQPVSIAVSYGSVSLDSIPSTILDNGVIRDTGGISAGFDVLYGGIATELYDVFGFNTVDVGAGLKMLRQNIGQDTRAAFGVDTGIIAGYNLEENVVDRVYLGASIHNLLATSMVWDTAEHEEAYLPLQVIAGARADLFEETLSIFANTAVDGIYLGAEYALQKSLALRGSSNFKKVSLGTGLLFEDVMGLGEGNYSARLDVNYTQNVAPFDSDPNFTVSVSVLGESRPKAPQILFPAKELFTKEKTTKVNGISPRNTTIRVYNNDTLVRTILSDRFGYWTLPNFPLKEGSNLISVKAHSLDQENSSDSNKVLIKSDSEPPKLTLKIYPDNRELVISVESNEDLSQIQASLDANALKFDRQFVITNAMVWTSRMPMPAEIASMSTLPNKLKALKLFATDKVGNSNKEETYPFFVELSYPQDKTVHYKDSIRYIGRSSKMVKSVEINGVAAYIDPKYDFALETSLKPGKNYVGLKVKTVEDKDMMYYARILRLVTFPDLDKNIKERREIEFLATLHMIFGDEDGNFYPNKNVTRRFIVRMMVKAGNYTLQKAEKTLFPDVPKNDPDADYINTAIQNGLVFAYPDGTFKPDQPLTLSEALYLLGNAGITDDSASPNDETQYIKRKDLALYLAYLPKYEAQIEKLIDWEKGYK